jgi:hypothetical protein
MDRALIVNIDLPPTGGLEAGSGDASSTHAQENQGPRANYDLFEAVSPYLQSLVDKPPRRSGNILHVELLGTPDEETAINHYMLVVIYDLAGGLPDIKQELSTLLPQGTQLSVEGSTFWQEWRRRP